MEAVAHCRDEQGVLDHILAAPDKHRELGNSHKSKDRLELEPEDSNKIALGKGLQRSLLKVAARQGAAGELLAVKGADLKVDVVVEVPNNSVPDSCSFCKAKSVVFMFHVIFDISEITLDGLGIWIRTITKLKEHFPTFGNE